MEEVKSLSNAVEDVEQDHQDSNVTAKETSPLGELNSLNLYSSVPRVTNDFSPFYTDVATEFGTRLKSEFFGGSYHYSVRRNSPVCFMPSVLISIGQHFNLIAPYDSPSPLPAISKQAAEILASTVELRLRLLIQTVSQFSRHFVGSKAQNRLIRFSHVIDALELYQIKIKKKINHILTFGSALESSRYSDVTHHLISPATKCFPPSVFLSHWNLSDSTSPDVSSFSSVCTEDFSSEPLVNPLDKQLPTVTIRWIAVDGRLMDAFQSETLFFYNPQSERVVSPNYKVNWRPYDSKCNTRESCPPFHTLNIVGQTEKIHHDLTREHYLLLNKLREIFRKPFLDPRTELSPPVLRSLMAAETSPGLRQLVPYLVHFACQQIYVPLASPALFSTSAAGLRTILRLIIALLRNPSVHLQYFVHQIVQAVQTLVLHPLLGCKELTVEGSLALRQAAATTLSFISEHFAFLHGPGIGGFVGRTVASVYRSALDVDQPVSTLLGAVIGLRCLGPRALQIILLPKLPQLTRLLILPSNPPTGPNSPLQHTINQFRVSLLLEILSAMSDILNETLTSRHLESEDFLSLVFPLHSGALDSLKEAFEIVSEVFGDTITPFIAAIVTRPSETLTSSSDRTFNVENKSNCPDVFSTVL